MLFNVIPRSRYLDILAEGQEGIVTFPTYIPGSYVIRELERNIIEIEGVRMSKNKFYVKSKFKYRIYTLSKDQREAISTRDYLFINPASVFPFQDINEKYCVQIETSWNIITPLKKEGNFYCGENYHEFADSPIEASPFLKEIKIDDLHSISTIDEIDISAIRKIVEEADKIIKPKEKYIFFFRRSDKNYGGIEHKNSSAIVVSWERKDLSELFAHEYFHRLNVKTLIPKDLVHNYEREIYTDLLWFAEGFTDYMALLISLRAGLDTPEEALRGILSSLYKLTFPGAKIMSLAESSYTTWIKYYRQDENFLNSSISYYNGGLSLAFYVDIKLTKNGKRIDEIFKRLPNRYSFSDIQGVLDKLGFYELDLVYSPARKILDSIKEEISLEFMDKDKPYYGIMLDNNKIRFVEDNSPADNAGLLPDDQIVAVNGINKPLEVKDEVNLTVLREGRLKDVKISSGRNPGHALRAKIDGKIAETIFGKNEVKAEYTSSIL